MGSSQSQSQIKNINQQPIKNINQQPTENKQLEIKNINYVTENKQHLVCKNSKKSQAGYYIREIIFYNNFNHPNIPKIIRQNRTEFCIPKYLRLSLYVPDNEIYSKYELKIKFKIFLKQILETLDYIHSKGICHSDIKEDNILEDEEGNYYIIDFDISEFYEFTSNEKYYLGTSGYIIENLDYNNDVNVDIFSLGITVIKLITGHPIYKVETSDFIIQNLNYFKNDIIEILGQDGYDLIKKMINKNNLISASEALNHDYFNEEYIKIDPNIENINLGNLSIIFTNNFRINTYIQLMIEMLELCLKNYFDSSIFLLYLHIFRQIISMKTFETFEEYKQHSMASFILAIIVNENILFDFNDIRRITGYTTNLITNIMFEILEFLNYDIKLIPFTYYVNDDIEVRIYLIFKLIMSEKYINLSLKEFSRQCRGEKDAYIENTNLFSHTETQKVLQFVINLIEIKYLQN